MINRQIVILFFCIFISYFSTALAALKIESEIADQVLMAGDQTSIQLKVNGARSDVSLKLPVVEGLSIQQQGQPVSSSQTTIINGKMKQFSGLVYQISVQTTKVGQYIIPPIRISYKGDHYQTKKHTLKVNDPGKSTQMFLEVLASQTEIYPTEPVAITLNWYIQDNIAEYEIRFPLLQQKDQINLKLSEEITRNKTTPLNIDRYEVPFNKSEQVVNGDSYTVYKTQLFIFPATVGKMIIQPATVKAFIQVGTEIKKNFFGDRVRVPKHKKIFAASKAVSINVKELPQVEKPVFFTGAIGKFDVALTANASRVKVGDPIEIQIKVIGQGKLDKIEAPILSEMEAYRKDFVIVDNLQPGDMQENSILFKQIIRPKHDRIQSIPPVHFSYFNTEDERYQTIKSNSVPLKVLPTRQVQKSDIINFDQNHPPENGDFAFSGQGIQANYIFEDALENHQEQALWYFLLVLPPLFYFGLVWFTRQQLIMSQNQALLRAKSAKSIKNKRLKEARQLIKEDLQKYLQALSVSVSGFISDRLNLGKAELTTIEIKKLVKDHHLDETLFNDVNKLLEEMDRYRFTGVKLPDEQREILFEQVSGILIRMHKTL
ncbi:MAG: protein BatD [Deltaproteobacteria bacterium]|jgi:hypothetical protein|nr:protein BatD [Deltaproteobacteria bacterium]